VHRVAYACYVIMSLYQPYFMAPTHVKMKMGEWFFPAAGGKKLGLENPPGRA
jgi:hypothetical protein